MTKKVTWKIEEFVTGQKKFSSPFTVILGGNKIKFHIGINPDGFGDHNNDCIFLFLIGATSLNFRYEAKLFRKFDFGVDNILPIGNLSSLQDEHTIGTGRSFPKYQGVIQKIHAEGAFILVLKVEFFFYSMYLI